jgi:hypothetical protein
MTLQVDISIFIGAQERMIFERFVLKVGKIDTFPSF